MTQKKTKQTLPEGAQQYQEWRDNFLADPVRRAIYEEEAAKSELWLQLIKARKTAGLTQEELAERLGVSQAQVARLEKRGYEAYTLTSLRRYVSALGEGFSVEIRIHTPLSEEELSPHSPIVS